MQDKYLFRGYQPELKKWVFGDLIHTPNGGTCIFTYENSFEDRVVVKPETVGIWVWRKDKYGRHMFVGDIYKRFNYIYLVEFDQIERRHMAICIGREKDFEKGSYEPIDEPTKSKFYELPLEDSLTEIIGNQWDNPELLTTQQG